MKKRNDLNNNREDFKDLSDEVSDVENQPQRHQALDEFDTQGDRRNTIQSSQTLGQFERNPNFQGKNIESGFNATRSGSLGTEMVKGVGLHFPQQDPKSEAGGYNNFKNALRQKIVADAKIDS